MNLEKLLVALTAIFFLVYGILFALFPSLFASFVTNTVPLTTSGLIDTRATYGGMSISVGILMLALANDTRTLDLGLLSVAIVLLCMATTRMLGIVVDGEPNTLMWVYLAAEVIPSIAAIVLYQRLRKNS